MGGEHPIKVGLGISRTKVVSQWNPVYKAFHDVKVILMRQTCGQRSSRAAESKRRALRKYFFERICYVFLMSKCRGDSDLGLCTTWGLAFGDPQRYDKTLQQKSPISPPKSPISQQKSPISQQKRPIYQQKSPTSPLSTVIAAANALLQHHTPSFQNGPSLLSFQYLCVHVPLGQRSLEMAHEPRRVCFKL